MDYRLADPDPMKHIYEKSFQYTPSKDHGPDYMQRKMEFYRKIEEARAKEPKKVCEIKPKIRAKT